MAFVRSSILPPRERACPNKRFLAKHVCDTCSNSERDAEKFAVEVDKIRENSGVAKTNKNSVFITNTMQYTPNNGNCVFNSPAPKYDCQLQRDGDWSCRYKGKAIAQHSQDNGHYFYRNDK